MGKKHKSPSRKKYEENNPNFTVRMPLEWHEDFDRYITRNGLSRRDFMGVSLLKIRFDFKKVRDQAYKEGHTNGHKMGDEEGYTRGYAEGQERGRREGYVEGAEYMYKKMKDQNKLWYYCAVCNEIKFIEPNSPEHKFIIDMMRVHGWKHPGCNFQCNPYL